MFGVQFYPTPKDLVSYMLDKVDWSCVRFILEPSAGKGDIADGVKERMKGKQGHIDCVEIDHDLRQVLKGRGYCVVANDFLKWDGHTRYDLIAMNPPFKDGDKHLAKALDMMKHGGQVVCLLNANTLTRTDSAFRSDLYRTIQEYNGTVEIIQNAFSNAERKTNVEVALVYVNIPKQSETDVDFGNLSEAEDYHSFDRDVTDLVHTDVFRALVQRYNFEAKLGLSLIDQYEKLQRYIPTNKNSAECEMIRLSIVTKEDQLIRDGVLSSANAYLRELRYKYWETLFASKEMRSLLTYEVMQSYMAKLEEFRSYDFTMSNILQIKLDLSKSLTDNIEKAIMDVFDKLTYAHSLQKSNNVHYYNGWKTNDCCKVKEKVIVPFYGLYDNRWGGHWDSYKAKDYMEQLEKILTYLDNGRTDGVTCDKIISDAFLSSSEKYHGQKIKCKYFDLEFKKKGTVHIFFTNREVLKKFNIFAGRKKNWLPPTYGKACYDEMSTKEKQVIDNFEGEKSYNETIRNYGFYLSGVELAMLGSGS